MTHNVAPNVHNAKATDFERNGSGTTEFNPAIKPAQLRTLRIMFIILVASEFEKRNS